MVPISDFEITLLLLSVKKVRHYEKEYSDLLQESSEKNDLKTLLLLLMK